MSALPNKLTQRRWHKTSRIISCEKDIKSNMKKRHSSQWWIYIIISKYKSDIHLTVSCLWWNYGDTMKSVVILPLFAPHWHNEVKWKVTSLFEYRRTKPRLENQCWYEMMSSVTFMKAGKMQSISWVFKNGILLV